MPITKGIGVISSVGYSDTSADLEGNFRRGVINVVGNDRWCDVVPPLDKRGYGNNLAAAVAIFTGNPAVGLIVTVGGLISALPAWRSNGKPFISLIGSVTRDSGFPNTVTGNFYGGVNLDTSRHDDRVNWLTGSAVGSKHKFPAGSICLLSNPDGAIAHEEMDAWCNAKPPRGTIFKVRTDHIDQDIKLAFSSLQGDVNLQAMIVSADAWFQDYKEVLIKAANGSKKHVCYPLQVYANDHGHNKPNGPHTKHGPKLATAYFRLGEMAATVINTNAPLTLEMARSEVHEG